MTADFPNVGRQPRFDLNHVSTEEVVAVRAHRGERTPGPFNAHYDLCSGDGCPCYREGLERAKDQRS